MKITTAEAIADRLNDEGIYAADFHNVANISAAINALGASARPIMREKSATLQAMLVEHVRVCDGTARHGKICDHGGEFGSLVVPSEDGSFCVECGQNFGYNGEEI